MIYNTYCSGAAGRTLRSKGAGYASEANRGRPLENYLKFVHSRYQHFGLGCLAKVPTEFLPIRDRGGKIISCKVEEKAVVDFLGRYGSVPVAVEAKHEEGHRISFARVEPHQEAFMDDWCKAPGAVGLVLVGFKFGRFFAVPWVFWKEALLMWRTKRNFTQGVDAYGWIWRTPGMASASAEQLHPAWEIKEGGRLTLPYLQIIDRMVR